MSRTIIIARACPHPHGLSDQGVLLGEADAKALIPTDSDTTGKLPFHNPLLQILFAVNCLGPSVYLRLIVQISVSPARFCLH